MEALGQTLKETREQLGLSLDDIQQKTKIRKRYLEAIEEGDFSVLPGVVYTRGFIKSYAEEVGLSGQKLLEQFGMLPEPQQEPVKPSIPQRAKNVRASSKNLDRSRGKMVQVLMTVGVMCLLIIGYWMITSRTTESQKPLTSPNPTQGVDVSTPPVVPTTPVVPSTEPKPDTNTDTTPLTPTNKQSDRSDYSVSGSSISVEITATSGECWMAITADGKSSYTGILKKGDSKTINANKEVSIKTGNSIAIDMKVNNRPVDIERISGAYNYVFQKQSE